MYMYNMHKSPYRYENIQTHTYISNASSNSGWIVKTEFGEEEPMLSSCLRRGEEVSHLELGGHIAKSNDIILYLSLNVICINFNVLCELMLHRITSYVDSTGIQKMSGHRK